MARVSRLICLSGDLMDGGDALRFVLDDGRPAFVQRWHGQVHAYVNSCAHVPVELDWNPGKLLDDSGEWLICATHGALYAPDSGECVAGPCAGRRLQALRLTEENGEVHFHDNEGMADE
ncbi:Rieske 2Fe-2S domain-containing protein [Uliginosibacterium paludis]|uniref:Rieske 2Fe-2S domain-containing protein n=1 Tax=Uliginosibacterium paludis TaxID=1615952 RepID=A0ABV2CLT0_9RHOO